MNTNDSKKPIQMIRSEIKYIVFIMLFVASILFNYFIVTKQVDMNAYRISQIEQARAEAWSNYKIECGEQIRLLQEIQKDVIKIKVKLKIE